MDIERQLERFEKGYRPRKLLRPATVGDGIRRLQEDEARRFAELYENSLSELDVCKFVPASGAASRMFRDLAALRGALLENRPVLGAETEKVLERFVENARRFPFAGALEELLEGGVDGALSSGSPALVLAAILDPGGLGYANVPKGLVRFHSYGGVGRTAFCEHFAEALGYANSRGTSRMHFTVPPDSTERFEREEKRAKELFSSAGVAFEVTYSAQDPATDTVAVTMDNEPVRAQDGSPVRRPAGHGALLGNLDALCEDCVFIKNIDNVAREEFLPETVFWKKALGGVLVSVRREIFRHLDALRSSGFSESLSEEIKSFCSRELFLDLRPALRGISPEGAKEKLVRALDRPVRVCGVVRNEGEPGGGPFWTDAGSGESLQIVESAEVDGGSSSQMSVWESSTHFNPVDIVCGTRNFRGEKFDLFDFVDGEAGIITEKSFGGRKIKALELPGLWNGSMAGWTTVFVEVPAGTFNPVKTVFDLLRPAHQVN